MLNYYEYGSESLSSQEAGFRKQSSDGPGRLAPHAQAFNIMLILKQRRNSELTTFEILILSYKPTCLIKF